MWDEFKWRNPQGLAWIASGSRKEIDTSPQPLCVSTRALAEGERILQKAAKEFHLTLPSPQRRGKIASRKFLENLLLLNAVGCVWLHVCAVTSGAPITVLGGRAKTGVITQVRDEKAI
jgi:hypothetical protein